MKIALVSHLSHEGPDSLLEKMQSGLSGLKAMPDVVCGPDYGLASHYNRKPVNQQERQYLLGRIKELSKQFPHTQIIPGTMPWIDKTQMYQSAPVYKSGKLQHEFFKERDCGEANLAESVGKKYFRGKSDDNVFKIDGKKICYEICGDHGNQNVDGCFLELISSLDSRGGFYISQINNGWKHYGATTNGIDGETACFLFDPNSAQRVDIINPIETSGKVSVFNLE